MIRKNIGKACLTCNAGSSDCGRQHDLPLQAGRARSGSSGQTAHPRWPGLYGPCREAQHCGTARVLAMIWRDSVNEIKRKVSISVKHTKPVQLLKNVGFLEVAYATCTCVITPGKYQFRFSCKRSPIVTRQTHCYLFHICLQVVFTNQVTTRVLKNEQSKLIPALGAS